MQTGSRYDAIAEWYDQSIGETGGSRFEGIEWPCLDRLLGDLRDRSVLDLACGQGFLSRILARRGARVIGIDLSVGLLDRARAREATNPLGIVYVQDDATVLASQPDSRFDLVICRYALMDIPDLTATCRAVARVLEPSGRFVATITHPCFYTPHAQTVRDENGSMVYWASDRYFDEGEWWSDNKNGVRGQVGAIHRTLSTYVNAGLAAGLTLVGLVEPRPVDEDADLALYQRIPWTLVLEWRKTPPMPPPAL
jgi:SAM-dependent methyltransferase